MSRPFGFKHTKETIEKIRLAQLGDKGNNWKGDNIKPGVGLHQWVRKIFPKPDTCDICNINMPFDLANKGIYDRNINNWWWLCRSCHMKLDGRIHNLRNQP